MLRKALLSITVALFSLMLLVIGVMAQTDVEQDTPAVTVQPNVTAANVKQTVPVTLTLILPGPTGPMTIEVPIFLSLDIRIGISPELTTTLEVTPSIVPEVEVEVDATATVESTAAVPTAALTPETTTEPTTEATAESPTATALPEDTEPTATPLPTDIPAPTATPEPVVVAPSCPDPRAVITSPGVNQVISGTVQIVGTATHENFQYYKVEYAQGADIDPDNTFSYLADARIQVTEGLLAAFDSTGFGDGPFTFKLTVVDNSGNFPPPCTVTALIAN